MIVVTGALGFIGMNLIQHLVKERMEVVAVDDFTNTNKVKNLNRIKSIRKIHRDEFIDQFTSGISSVRSVIHLGARTDTLETDPKVFQRLNLEYSKALWRICSKQRIPLIYASSAATYGNGEFGYSDDHALLPKLKPLNEYAVSKQDFDIWALKQTSSPLNWYGLKFFNVYGPYEQHKGSMASMISQIYWQLKNEHRIRLFKSHRAGIEDGDQRRDFIHVYDVVEVIKWLMTDRPESGIYNVGTGHAVSFNEIVLEISLLLDQRVAIDYFDMPLDIREKYQYHTEASIEKLQSRRYTKSFLNLKEGLRSFSG